MFYYKLCVVDTFANTMNSTHILSIVGFAALALALISFCIFINKGYFGWENLDLLRQFPVRRPQRLDGPLTPSGRSRGLNELLIRDIPTFQFRKDEGEFNSLSKCVVCLNEFQDHEMLRVLPKCSHAFHSDCIDVWLQNNSNCPLCRSTISSQDRNQPDRLVAPNSSPQESSPLVGSFLGGDEDFLVIEICREDGNWELEDGQEDIGDSRRYLVQPRSHSARKLLHQKFRKFHHHSIMGDEDLNIVMEEDDEFCVTHPIRSFSMDSATDRHVYLSVQEIIRQSMHDEDDNQVMRNNEECSTSGMGSRTEIFPA